MALASGTRLDPYEILEPLGTGGRGEVYRARAAKLVPCRSGPLLLALLVAVLPSAVLTRPVHAEPPTPFGDYLWLDVDGQPLPFQDHATIRDVLRSARVVSRETLGRRMSATEKLLLETAETRFRAVFRMMDLHLREPSASPMKRPKRFRDAAIFECAAYEVSQLLGIRRVPPVVERRIGTLNGSVQLWAEETRTELELREQRGLRPPDLTRWDQQRQIMYAFDSLIANFDRNQGNVLLDRGWNMWFIDHTRAFEPSSELLYRERLTGCERGLWNSLREMDEDVFRQRLEPLLEHPELSNLLSRRLSLIRHIQGLIDTHGEDAVIFELRPPDAKNADWND